MIAPLQEKLTSIEAVQARDEPAQVGGALRASISLEVRALGKGHCQTNFSGRLWLW